MQKENTSDKSLGWKVTLWEKLKEKTGSVTSCFMVIKRGV